VVVRADEDYYGILGVDRSADKKAIKQAYRQKARKFHPVSIGCLYCANYVLWLCCPHCSTHLTIAWMLIPSCVPGQDVNKEPGAGSGSAAGVLMPAAASLE